MNGSDTCQASEFGDYVCALTPIDESDPVTQSEILPQLTMRSTSRQGQSHQPLKMWDPVFSKTRACHDQPLLSSYIDCTHQDRIKRFLSAIDPTPMLSYEYEMLKRYFLNSFRDDCEDYKDHASTAWVDSRSQQDHVDGANRSLPLWLSPAELHQLLRKVSTPSHIEHTSDFVQDQFAEVTSKYHRRLM
jgi:hypothetical protein